MLDELTGVLGIALVDSEARDRRPDAEAIAQIEDYLRQRTEARRRATGARRIASADCSTSEYNVVVKDTPQGPTWTCVSRERDNSA